MDYQFVSCSAAPDYCAQLAALSNAAFAEYEGAPEVDADFLAWYLRRPGSSADLCVAALHGDRLVSTVLIAIQTLHLGGEPLRCGIIDTVSTYPEHRQRGLAHHLMEMAHERLQALGAEAAVLYTNPENHPYHFYARLGYQTRARASFLAGTRPAPAGRYTVRPAADAEAAAIREMVNATYGAYEGFARLDDALWDWHRVSRPTALPLTLLVATEDDRVRGTLAIARSELLLHGERQILGFVSDAVYPDRECLQDLLAAAPERALAALHDCRAPQAADLEALGLHGQLGEVAMVLPFTERATRLLANPSTPWYVMVESVVGV